MRKFSVKGKSSKQLTDLSLGEFSRLTRSELSQVVSRLSSTANKRLKTLEQMEVPSPALRSVQKSGGKFGARGKSLSELRSEYMRLRRFLGAKTSTKKGFIKVEKEFMKRIGRTEIDEEVRKKMWQLYNNMEGAIEPFVKGSEAKQAYLYNYVEENKYDDLEELIEKVRIDLGMEYEKRGRVNAADEMAEYFRIS